MGKQKGESNWEYDKRRNRPDYEPGCLGLVVLGFLTMLLAIVVALGLWGGGLLG